MVKVGQTDRGQHGAKIESENLASNFSVKIMYRI